METEFLNVTTVRIGNGTKVHYAFENSSVTFCNLWRGIRKANGAAATCEKCEASKLLAEVK
jgi:hypothetical protein